MVVEFPRSPQIGRRFAQLFPSSCSRSATGAGGLGRTLPLGPFPLTGWDGSLRCGCGWPLVGPIASGACNLSLRAAWFGGLGPI
jgi:hypothetical protein